MSLPVAILSGGQATRLYPLTLARPKALLEIAGKSFLARQLEYLRDQGILDVVLCTGFLGEQIAEAVGDGSAFGLRVQYSWDGPSPLGTGGAIRHALPLLGEHFFVFYGDSYLPIDFSQVEAEFVKCEKPALMTVFRNRNQWDASNVIFRDGVIREYNKLKPVPEMSHIDYGLGVLSASLLASTPTDTPFDLSDLYHELSTRGLLAGFEVYHRFFEIGSREGLKETIEYFARTSAP